MTGAFQSAIRIPHSAFLIRDIRGHSWLNLHVPYVRDKRSPTPKSEAVSRVMSANRAKNSKPELTLRKALRQACLRGYRLHRTVKTGSGSDRGSGFEPIQNPKSRIQNQTVRPDISFVGKRVAIFVHGCYWHRCPKCAYPLPKNNTEFWQEKFTRNTTRDHRKRTELESIGWTVITVWK